MTNTLRQVDLAFIVDTTGSMGAFIQAAQRQMTEMLTAVTQAADIPIDLAVGIVEYRDHPPQERSFVTRAHKFEGQLKKVQKSIDKLKPSGGGDAPEAVYDGLQTAAEALDWRPHSRRLAMLIGDAPPHRNCLCGLTADSATALIEAHGIILYGLGLTPNVTDDFTDLAQRTGGGYFRSGQNNQAIEALQATLQAEFQDLAFDGRVLQLCQQPGWTVDSLSADLETTIGPVSASLSRLGRRGLLG